MDGRLDELSIVFEQVDQERRTHEEEDVAYRVDEFGNIR